MKNQPLWLKPDKLVYMKEATWQRSHHSFYINRMLN